MAYFSSYFGSYFEVAGVVEAVGASAGGSTAEAFVAKEAIDTALSVSALPTVWAEIPNKSAGTTDGAGESAGSATAEAAGASTAEATAASEGTSSADAAGAALVVKEAAETALSVLALPIAWAEVLDKGGIVGAVGEAAGTSTAGAVGASLTPYRETPAGRKRKRYYVEIDGQEFEVADATEALALLDRAKALAERVAPQTAEQVVAKAIRKAQAPRIKPPAIKASPEIAEVVAKPQQDIERIYRDAAMAAEIRLLMELRAEQDDEEALLLLI